MGKGEMERFKKIAFTCYFFHKVATLLSKYGKHGVFMFYTGVFKTFVILHSLDAYIFARFLQPKAPKYVHVIVSTFSLTGGGVSGRCHLLLDLVKWCALFSHP